MPVSVVVFRKKIIRAYNAAKKLHVRMKGIPADGDELNLRNEDACMHKIAKTLIVSFCKGDDYKFTDATSGKNYIFRILGYGQHSWDRHEICIKEWDFRTFERGKRRVPTYGNLSTYTMSDPVGLKISIKGSSTTTILKLPYDRNGKLDANGTAFLQTE